MCGGGDLWRQRWTNTEEQESKQGTDTPSLIKVIAAYYLYLELSVLHSSVRVAHEDDKRNNRNSSKKKQCRDGFLKNASRRWQRPLSEVENISGSRDRVKCPTRRTARERKASAATVTEMSRKMEAVQRRQEARLRRLHPEASARVVREEADADVEVWWCYAAFLGAELAAPSGAAPLCSRTRSLQLRLQTTVSWSLPALSFDHDLRPRKNKMDGFGPSVIMWTSK